LLISIIVAMAKNRVIGNKGQLPWQLPEDLRRFKELTMGQTLLMGRKTFESIGGPLPGRKIIVLSRNPSYRAAGCTMAGDLKSGIASADGDELFICGGGEIYRQALPLAERIYLTELEHEVVGDTFFPEIPIGRFKEVRSQLLVEGAETYHFSVLESRN